MSFVMVFVSVLPLLVVLAVAAVKALELALDRHIASTTTVALYTTVVALVASAVVGIVFAIWLASVLSHDTS